MERQTSDLNSCWELCWGLPCGQWLKLCAFSAKGVGLITGQGTRIPHATGHDQKEKKKTHQHLKDSSGLWVLVNHPALILIPSLLGWSYDYYTRLAVIHQLGPFSLLAQPTLNPNAPWGGTLLGSGLPWSSLQGDLYCRAARFSLDKHSEFHFVFRLLVSKYKEGLSYN